MDEFAPETHGGSGAKTLLIIFCVAAISGFVGWRIGRDQVRTRTSSSPASRMPPSPRDTAKNKVSEVASYTLPSGWREYHCPSAVDTVFVRPAGVESLDCDAEPASPIQLALDANNTTDCKSLAPAGSTHRHVCISLDINGNKSLQASTVRDTTIDVFYVDVGTKVIKLSYEHGSDAVYQADFEQLAKSVRSK